eukprot:m.113187 g.113187  ORF g.113187 m.113187 type:complete len:1208 (+) comp17067_c0_seq1:213-3836(+)
MDAHQPMDSHALSRMVDDANVKVEKDIDTDEDARSTTSTKSLPYNQILLGPNSELRNIKKILVANRGEIAIRVCRAAHELGVPSVGIFSKEDSYALHRFRADESYLIGEGLSPLRAYLEIPEIIRICKESGADAVHPGYGFLSENADFVHECVEAGITFIGPTEASIRALGDKVSARTIAIEANVPVVPGTDGPCTSLEQAQAFVAEHGLPVLIKASFGGGGRGMRVVSNHSDLEASFTGAIREAENAFGNGEVFIEKYLPSPRHIEVQILGDKEGNTIHLYERDCSIQRRHQKVVEMAPSQNLPESVRTALLKDAVTITKHVKYHNAGTVEFLYDGTSGKHYFIEVNPRVQVEHTVTEQITGIDIVKSQICIADGWSLKRLKLDGEIPLQGVAIQVRITTEDPKRGFQPDTGRLQVYRSAGGPGVRLDSSVTAGSIISPHYDSLMVKVICSARSYVECVRRMQRVLTEFRIRGIKTNVPFLLKVMGHPLFLQGKCTTTFIDDTPELFDFTAGSDKTTRLLNFLGDIVVNGSIITDATKYPDESINPIVPRIDKAKAAAGPPDGWRQVLQKSGPKAFAAAVRQHKQALITDTTWRDAHQSLLATRIRTVDLTEIAPATSYALNKCFSLECWGGATFDVSLRFLKECPWERLRRLRELVPNIPFQMLLRGANAVGYTSYPDNVVNTFVQRAKDTGMDIFRVFDSLNYIPNLKVGINAIHLAGGVVEAVICYTGDVLDEKCEYNIEYYLGKVQELMELDIHILAIKDMAGLLKPRAATKLVGAIREKFPDLPIHVHSHDTAGTGVASMLAALDAGADIVDCATDALSGLTSQPSFGAVVNALRGSAKDSEIDPRDLNPLNDYWEETRRLYRAFESTDLRSGNSDVYLHEMPGGQYTNLQFQAGALGLAGRWPAIKRAYAEANKLCGNIIKVTPSSKVIGDMAQFMVANNLETGEQVKAQAKSLDFPESVKSFFQGNLGQPHNGFPEQLRKDIIRGLPEINDRPGANLEPFDFVSAKKKLQDLFPEVLVEDCDVVSYSLYPKVTEEFLQFRHHYGNLAWLPTKHFLRPMNIGQEIEIPYAEEKNFNVRLLAVGRLLPEGDREVFWEVNGKPRLLSVPDKKSADIIAAKSRPKATEEPGSVGAAMTGLVVEIKVTSGATVKRGDTLLVLSAMKMETAVSAPIDGTITQIHVAVMENVLGGDLLVTITPSPA